VNGYALIKLQATLVNELTDLEDVTVHLVVGVPSFAFKDNIDPMSLQDAAVQLSQHFQEGAQTAFAFGNAIMTNQMAAPVDPGAYGHAAGDDGRLGPDVAITGKTEDLYVFTVKHITLKKGERMVVPVAEFLLEYSDIYTLNIPFTPPREMLASVGGAQQAEWARLYQAPKVMHKIRMTNSSKHPLTTAPTLILRDGRVMAQGLMTYAAVGSKVDLEITAAVNVQVKKEEREVKRKPNALSWQSLDYWKAELEGVLTMTSFGDKEIEVEVVRNVLGHADKADHGGKVIMVNTVEDQEYGPAGRGHSRWSPYSWPYWWHQINGIGRIKWKIKLKPGKSLDLTYKWHYFWR